MSPPGLSFQLSAWLLLRKREVSVEYSKGQFGVNPFGVWAL